jgi:hypothetical protein
MASERRSSIQDAREAANYMAQRNNITGQIEGQ